jgi:CheY-like chemotaxis protein
MQDAQSIRVLVFEENPLDQDLLRQELQKSDVGQRVLFLSDPQAVLELLRGPDAASFKRDLIAIFLDVDLPQVSGMELLTLIRATDGMETFPVMVMTTSPAAQTVAACRKHRVTALMAKPVSLRSFSNTLADLFHAKLC